MSAARRLRLALFAVALFAQQVLCARAAQASPEDLFGYGGRTSAMGATGTAHAEGYETAWHNPALASKIRESKLTLGYSGAVFALDATGLQFPGRISTAPAKGIVVGPEVPIPFGGRLRDRVGIAFAVYTPTEVLARARVVAPETSQYPILATRAQSLTLRGGLGLDVGWGVRVGVGVAALAQLEGTVVAGADASGRASTQVNNELVAIYAPTVGVTWETTATPTWRVGVTARGALDARFRVAIDGTKLSSIALPLLNIAGRAQYDPAQVALELARIEKLNVLAVQAVYKKWSAFPGFLEPTVSCSEGGPGACGLSPPSVDWHDTFALRAGAEQGVALSPAVTLFMRGGAFIETSPLPGTLPVSEAFDVGSKKLVPVPTRYLDSTRAVLTAGLGASLKRPVPIDVDVFFQYHSLLPRTIRSVDDEGAALSSGEASGHIRVVGLTAGVRF